MPPDGFDEFGHHWRGDKTLAADKRQAWQARIRSMLARGWRLSAGADVRGWRPQARDVLQYFAVELHAADQSLQLDQGFFVEHRHGRFLPPLGHEQNLHLLIGAGVTQMQAHKSGRVVPLPMGRCR